MIGNLELIDSVPSDLLDFYTIEDLLDNFYSENSREANKHKLEGIKILLSYYSYYNYSGQCFVLYTQNNRLYTVEAEHCSCYGLEGFWCPEETNVEVLTHLYFNGDYKRKPWGVALAKLLNIIEESTKERLDTIRFTVYAIEPFILEDLDVKLNPDLGYLREDISTLLESLEEEFNFSNLYELNNYVCEKLNCVIYTNKYLNVLQQKKYEKHA